MTTAAPTLIRVCTLADLKHESMKVVSAENRTVLVLLHDGAVYAIDNRCPCRKSDPDILVMQPIQKQPVHGVHA